MTAARKILPPVTFIPLMMLATACASIPLRAPWEKSPPLETRHFTIYAEPGTHPGEFSRLPGIEQEKERLEASFFPGRKGSPVRVILFRDAASYRRHRVVQIDSVADYDRVRRQISIAAGSDLYVWRHELSHALMEETAGEAPYWFQEGLAQFLQNWTSPNLRSCEKPVPASLHPDISAGIAELAARFHDPTFSFNNRTPRDDLLFHVNASAAFVFYLYHKQVLFQLIEELRVHGRRDPLFPLTAGDRTKKERILDDYRRWLTTGLPYLPLPGC